MVRALGCCLEFLPFLPSFRRRLTNPFFPRLLSVDVLYQSNRKKLGQKPFDDSHPAKQVLGGTIYACQTTEPQKPQNISPLNIHKQE